MNKLLQTSAIGFVVLTAAVAATSIGLVTQQQQFAYASTYQEREDCTYTEHSDPELEGWRIETCENGNISYISPNGARCVYGEQSGNMSCDDMVAKGYNIG